MCITWLCFVYYSCRCESLFMWGSLWWNTCVIRWRGFKHKASLLSHIFLKQRRKTRMNRMLKINLKEILMINKVCVAFECTCISLCVCKWKHDKIDQTQCQNMSFTTCFIWLQWEKWLENGRSDLKTIRKMTIVK
jgi:hypothetical protein